MHARKHTGSVAVFAALGLAFLPTRARAETVLVNVNWENVSKVTTPAIGAPGVCRTPSSSAPVALPYIDLPAVADVQEISATKASPTPKKPYPSSLSESCSDAENCGGLVSLGVPICGDGIVDLGERCDDGNNLANDFCSNDCLSAGAITYVGGERSLLLPLSGAAEWALSDASSFEAIGETFAKLGTGCGLRSDGTVWSPSPSPPRWEVFSDCAVDYTHGCGLHPDGSISCWGASLFGGVEVAAQAGATFPPGGTGYLDVAVSAVGLKSCALNAAGEIVCWGGDERFPLPPPPVGGGFERVEMGAWVCGLRQGRVICGDWTGDWTFPGDGYVDLSVGLNNVCGLTDDQRLLCSGVDEAGYLDVVSNGIYACALTTDGRVDCWEFPEGA